MYSIIPEIRGLTEPTKTQVREGFAKSLKPVWYTLTGIVSFALIVSLLMKNIPLQNVVDKRWALQDGKKGEENEHENAEEHGAEDARRDEKVEDSPPV